MPTVPMHFLARVDRGPDQVAVFSTAGKDPLGTGTPVPDLPGWVGYTLGPSLALDARVARRLWDTGVRPGDAVAILAETCPGWVAADLATVGLGAVTVGIYPSLLPEQIAFQLRHSQAKVLIAEDQAAVERLGAHRDACPDLLQTFTIYPSPAGSPTPQLTPAEGDWTDWFRERCAAVSLDDRCTIVYTSGTTGDPKGAVLTHGNFDAIIQASTRAMPTRPGDRSVVFLPLAHSLQRFALYRGLSEGAVGYYADSIHELPAAIQAARPHVLASVPRMLEKIKATAEARAAQKSAKAAQVLAWAIDVGTARNHLLRRGRPVPFKLQAQHALAERLVYRKVRAGLGGHLRVFISGGAALSVDVAEWFEAVGIDVREAWGLTETCAPATTNTETEVRFGTVGRALPGVHIKLAPDGELLVKSAGNFIGYHRDPEATRAAFTDDGYFRTGDLGDIDEDGFVRIIDRKKELIVTSSGKNIPPVNIEKRLEQDLVGQAVVIGSERPYLVALLCCDPEAIAALARVQGWTGGYAEHIARPEVRARVGAVVDAANRGLARFETIKRWALLPRPLSAETGELTPTLKLKRRVIQAEYSSLIDGLYRDEARVS